MCDERTASRMGALSTAKRNGLSGVHIIQSAQLQQHWTYGLDAPQYTHQAQLKLPKTNNPAASVQLPTPGLADLLNPITNDELLYANPDPYDLSTVDDPDDEDGDEDDYNNEESRPRIIRGGASLDIDEIVDLQSRKLRDRYSAKTPDRHPVVATSSLTKTPEKWVQDQYNPANLDF